MILFRSKAFYLSLLGIGLTIAFILFFKAPPPQKKPLRTPAANPFAHAIAGSGIIESLNRNIALGAPNPGVITAIFVKVSDYVKKGQPLFQVDPRELQAELKLQKAHVKVAEARLKRLQDQYKRLLNVPDPRAVTADVLDTKENDVEVAKAELKVRLAEVERLEELIERQKVRAPRNGVILQNNIRVGEYYSPSPSTSAMVFGDIKKLQVRVDIDEQNASRFSPDFKAVAFPKNNPKLEISLTFEREEPYIIPKKSLTGSSIERVDTRVLQVIYTFTKPKDFKVYVGQQVDVFIEAE